jgi:hypothetical protein
MPPDARSNALLLLRKISRHQIFVAILVKVIPKEKVPQHARP